MRYKVLSTVGIMGLGGLAGMALGPVLVPVFLGFSLFNKLKIKN